MYHFVNVSLLHTYMKTDAIVDLCTVMGCHMVVFLAGQLEPVLVHCAVHICAVPIYLHTFLNF